MRRTGDRTLRLALLISAVSVVLLIAAIGALALLTSSKDTAAKAPTRRVPSPSRQSPSATPTTPAPSGPNRSTLVLDWPESEPPGPVEPGPAEPEAKPAMEGAELAVDQPKKPITEPEEPTPKPEAAPSFDHPEELLASKGLGAHGDYWSLPEESELSKRLRAVQKTWGDILESQRAVAKAQEIVDNGEAAMLASVQKLGELGVLLRTARTAEENNRIVGAMNELQARMVIAKRQLEEVEKARDQASGALISRSSEFEGQLLEFREVYDKVEQGYEALAADPAVAEAIRRVNEAGAKKTRLGPGTLFVSIGKRLEGLESKVFSESIPLRRGEGNLWYVPVVFRIKNFGPWQRDTFLATSHSPVEVGGSNHPGPPGPFSRSSTFPLAGQLDGPLLFLGCAPSWRVGHGLESVGPWMRRVFLR